MRSVETIGVVEGIPITKIEWDHLAEPYFHEVEQRAGRQLTEDERALLRKNVLEELIRERLWVADAKRRGFTATDAEIDAHLGQNPYFHTNGKFDPAKFRDFKFSPASNYSEIKAQVANAVLLEKYSKWMEQRYSPTEAQLKKEFSERTAQASIRFLWLTPDLVTLDPQASPEQIRAYYESHPDEFRNPEEARLTYIRVPIETQGIRSDTLRAVAELAALSTAKRVLEAARLGKPIDPLARPFGGTKDTGMFHVGEPIRGLGRAEELAAAVRDARPKQWLPAPVRVGPYYVVARVEEHRPQALRPFKDAVALAKRKADAKLHETETDSLARLEYTAHPEQYRLPLLRATVLARAASTFDDPRPISDREVSEALARLKRSSGVSDTARAWADSVLKALPERIRTERALSAGYRTLEEAASRWKRGESPEGLAKRYAATVSRLSIYKGEPPTAPRLLEGSFLDSLYQRSAGSIAGPRALHDSLFLVRVDEVNDRFQPPFEAIRPELRAAIESRRASETEREAQAYYAAHKGEYRTPQRYAFDYVVFRRMKPDSVPVPEDSIRAYYERHPLEFTVPAKAHARHILIGVKPGDGPGAKAAARKRGQDVLRRLKAGADFAALAKELSEDRGSAAQGGDLGEITRGQVVKEFGDAAFALKPGQTSGLVESQFGFHIIKVESLTPQRLRPLDDCRDEIHGVLGEGMADSLALRTAETFAGQASKTGASFQDLARSHGGALSSPPIAAREPVGSLGVLPGLEQAIRSLPSGGVSRPIEFGEGYVVARLGKSVPPAEAPFPEVKQEVIRDAQIERRRSVADSIDTTIRRALRSGGNLETLAVPLGGLRVSRLFPRHGPVPELVRDSVLARDSTLYREIFASRPGTVLPPRRGELGTLYAVVDSVIVSDAKDYAQHRQELRREILDQRSAAWTERLRSRAKIELYRKDL